MSAIAAIHVIDALADYGHPSEATITRDNDTLVIKHDGVRVALSLSADLFAKLADEAKEAREFRIAHANRLDAAA